jgi:putative toxin-antitoxin system, antitoxin component, xre family
MAIFERKLTPNEKILGKTLAENIKKARIQSGYTIAQVAEELHRSKGELSQVESNKRPPSALLLGELAELFDVSVAYFYSGHEADVGEEKYFEISRMIIPMRKELDKHAALLIRQYCTKAFPASDEFIKLVDEANTFIQQADKLIGRNYDGAWQEMKGGNHFETSLKHLAHRVRTAREAHHLANRAKDDLNTHIRQMELF